MRSVRNRWCYWLISCAALAGWTSWTITASGGSDDFPLAGLAGGRTIRDETSPASATQPKWKSRVVSVDVNQVREILPAGQGGILHRVILDGVGVDGELYEYGASGLVLRAYVYSQCRDGQTLDIHFSNGLVFHSPNAPPCTALYRTDAHPSRASYWESNAYFSGNEPREILPPGVHGILHAAIVSDHTDIFDGAPGANNMLASLSRTNCSNGVELDVEFTDGIHVRGGYGTLLFRVSPTSPGAIDP